MRIKKGDKVKIITGKDRNKEGVVASVLPTRGKVVVDGLNIIKKHLKPKREGEKGQRVEISAPITISKVMLVCPKCKKSTRIGYKVEGDKKVRVCKKCNSDLS